MGMHSHFIALCAQLSNWTAGPGLIHRSPPSATSTDTQVGCFKGSAEHSRVSGHVSMLTMMHLKRMTFLHSSLLPSTAVNMVLEWPSKPALAAQAKGQLDCLNNTLPAYLTLPTNPAFLPAGLLTQASFIIACPQRHQHIHKRTVEKLVQNTPLSAGMEACQR